MEWGTFRRRRTCRAKASNTPPRDAALKEVYRLLLAAHRISRKQKWAMLCYLIAMAVIETEAMAALMDMSDE